MSLTGRNATCLGPEGPAQTQTSSKILIQGMNFTPEMIGVGRYTGELAHALAGYGHVIEVITAQPHYPGFAPLAPHPHQYRRSRDNGVTVTRCPLLLRQGGRGIWRLLAPLSFALSSAPVLFWRVIASRPALVLCVEPTLLAAPAAILAARLIGARLALHVQDLEVDAAFATAHLRGRLLRRVAMAVERRLLAAFDSVITISDGMALRLRHKGVSPARLTILRNWIGCSDEEDGPDPEGLRSELGIAPDEQVVVYAGHLGAKQAVPLLIEALRRLSARRAVRIIVAGAGPMACRIAEARDSLPNLLLLPLQTEARHTALLALADVHVLPQDARAADLVFPSKLGAMLASGRPVVVTAAPESDLSRWLGSAATVVPPDDPEALAAALDAALCPDAMNRSAQALALADTLDPAQILPSFEAHLRELVTREPYRRSRLRFPWFATPSPAPPEPEHG